MFKKRNSFKSSKKPHPRRSASLSALNSLDQTLYSQNDMQIDYDGEIRLSLGAYELAFRGGEWVGEYDPKQGKTGPNTPSIPSEHYKELLEDKESLQQEKEKLQTENQRLHEENKMLKIKFEGLLDMMARYVAQNLPAEELEKIGKIAEKESEKIIEKEVERVGSPQYDVIS